MRFEQYQEAVNRRTLELMKANSERMREYTEYEPHATGQEQHAFLVRLVIADLEVLCDEVVHAGSESADAVEPAARWNAAQELMQSIEQSMHDAVKRAINKRARRN